MKSKAACEVGYIEPSDPFNYRMAVSDLIQPAAEPALTPGQYEFASSRLSQCLSEKLLYLRNNYVLQRIPPADINLSASQAGRYLPAVRKNQRPCRGRAMLLKHLEQQAFTAS